MIWSVDFTTPGWRRPVAHCPRCAWTEVRSFGQVRGELVLVRPCEEHR